MVSNVSYTVSSTFHRQRFRCHVSQNGETTIYDLDEVYVEYKPTVVNLTINKEVNENEALDAPNCQANSYPAAKINYQVGFKIKDPIDAREKLELENNFCPEFYELLWKFYEMTQNLDESSQTLKLFFRIARPRINISLIC